MPADTGGSTGTRTTKTTKKSIGSTLGRAVANVTSGSRVNKNSARRASKKSSGGGGSRRYSGGSSSSSSSRRSSGGGGGGGSSRSVATPRTPSAPSIGSYLGTDSVYQTGLSGNKRSLADYLSELGRRRGEATTQFNQTKGSMERDRTRQLKDLENEFASRGLIQSGLYGEEQGRFQQQFTDQMNALSQQQAALLADLLAQQRNYQRENDLANQQLKQEALARRAAKYKIM